MSAAAPASLAAAAPAPAAARARCPFHALAGNGIAAGLLAGAVVTAFVLFGLGGARYFATPLRVRGYVPVHRLLRPSGPVGQLLGVAGSALMLLTALYVVRKRTRRLARAGALKNWLEFHVFCGVFGPILISLHTTFKFNGLVSVAYWSMVLVVLSGFVGRVLYARIPRTLKGEELTHAELAARATELRRELAETTVPFDVLLKIERFERETVAPGAGGPFRVLADRRRAAALRRELAARGVAHEVIGEALRLAVERATLMRRIAALKRTKRLFSLWHVFHLPLVWILFVIFVLHVSVATYLGYTFLSR